MLEAGTFGIFPAAMAKGLSAQEQTVLAWIWFHKNQSGRCWPSYARLANECGLGRTCVIKCINSLCEKGLIVKSNRFSLSGDQESNMYDVVIGGGSPDDRGVSRGDRGVSPDDHRTISSEPEETTKQEEAPPIGKEAYKKTPQDTLKSVVGWAVARWQDRLGVMPWGRMQKALRPVLGVLEPEQIKSAMSKYISEANPKFGPSPEKFAAVCVSMAGKKPQNTDAVIVTEEWSPD
jgi:hypothetical protein